MGLIRVPHKTMYTDCLSFYRVTGAGHRCLRASFSSTLLLRARRPVSLSACFFWCSLSQSSSDAYRNSSSHTVTESNRAIGSSPFKNPTVSVFWDLDNKPPKASPYHAALYLRHAASQFGCVVDMVAYANRHAFLHIPDWVRRERQERKQLDVLEQKGMVTQEQPYVCRVCGRKCKTNLLLKKHFKQLHEREQHKRMSRLNSLKGKKKAKYRDNIRAKSEKYKEAARPILVPKVGFGLDADLRRAGVYVRTVHDKPQAADIALKQRMAESISRGIKCLCLVSDDTDFAEMLVDARAQNLKTIVFGESKSLKRFSDFWFPWDDVHQGANRQEFDYAVRSWIHTEQRNQESRQAFTGSRTSSHGYDIGNTILDDTEVEHRTFLGTNPTPRSRASAFSEEEVITKEEDVLYLSDLDDDDDDDGELFDEDSEDENEWEVHGREY